VTSGRSESIVVTDVGSTTSKALLFELGSTGWRLAGRGEAPTTVEAPDEDVTVGVVRAIRNLERCVGRELVDASGDCPRMLADAYLSTSSAGGGLQMVVCGNVAKFTGESARRAALGGGAVLLDVFSADDGRSLFERMERLRSLRPDIILLSGGIEGGQTVRFVLEMCDFISAANPRPKFGHHYQLPVIYAGNSAAAPAVEDLLGGRFKVTTVPNLRPDFATENLEPTRTAIHDVFIEHVMAHAPGYPRLAAMVTSPVVPTPAAVGDILQMLAKSAKTNVLCVDIGGATTDVFSVIDGHYHRTVSANYGMSYSAGNVLASAGPANVARWLPMNMGEADLCHRIGNKMINPTSVPTTVEDLFVEQGLAREAMRLSLDDHREIARVRRQRWIVDGVTEFAQKDLLRMGRIGLIVGSGGVLSHAPLRGQAAAMLIDAFEPEGVTELAVDSVFMLPHLGILAREHPDAALDLLWKDCLVPLGTCVAPTGRLAAGLPGLKVAGHSAGGRKFDLTVAAGDIRVIPLSPGETADIILMPMPPLNVGLGPGIPRRCRVNGGVTGLILDLRGRPLDLGRGDDRAATMAGWLARLGAVDTEPAADPERGAIA
jgi:uncharacterized protein (TIGR01319 family)